jgi:hypothetical protein
MRRIRTAAVSVMVAAGFIGAVAAPASAAKPGNYGTCVSVGFILPSVFTAGPANSRGIEASAGRGGGVQTGVGHSGGKPRFTDAHSCSF